MIGKYLYHLLKKFFSLNTLKSLLRSICFLALGIISFVGILFICYSLEQVTIGTLSKFTPVSVDMYGLFFISYLIWPSICVSAGMEVFGGDDSKWYVNVLRVIGTVLFIILIQNILGLLFMPLGFIFSLSYATWFGIGHIAGIVIIGVLLLIGSGIHDSYTRFKRNVRASEEEMN